MITERELIIAAKTFRANCVANSEKMSFSDACKIVLLSELLFKGHDPTQVRLMANMVMGKSKTIWEACWKWVGFR